MFRLWGKLIKNNDICSDQVFELDKPGMDINDKLHEGMRELCYHFDIGKPMWLSENIMDMNMIGKTSFYDHHFVESIDFDSFEIEILEHE